MPVELRTAAFWLFWVGTHTLLFALGWILQQRDDRLALLNKLRYSVWSSRGAGLVLAFDGALLLLPMMRVTLTWLRPRFRRLPLDENAWLHRQTAYMMLIFTVIHVTAHYVNFYNVERLKARPVTAWQIHYTEVGGLTGHIMLFCMLMMYTTAAKVIRLQSFRTFSSFHHLVFVFYGCFYSHASGCFVRDTARPFSIFTQGRQFWQHCIGYQSWRVDGLIGLAYIVERLYRLYRAHWQETRFLAAIQHPEGVVELRIEKKAMSYKAGQYLLLNIPGLSDSFDYHPFTITSSPDADPYVSVHIREVGEWTRSVGPYFRIHQHDKTLGDCQPPKIRIDGPYGCPAEDIDRNEFAVVIGA